MWLGGGGVIAIFVCAWACIWASRSLSLRSWWRRPTTPLAFLTAAISGTLISVCVGLVFPIGELSRSLSPDKKVALRALMDEIYNPFWTTAVGLLAFALALAMAGRRRVAAEPEGVWWVHGGMSLSLALCTALSVAIFAVFHVTFMLRDPVTMSLGAGANATRALIYCGFVSWIGLLLASGWGLSRGIVALRTP